MAKKKRPEDDETQIRGDSQFEVDSPDDVKKKRSPFIFLGVSVVFALVLALVVLYLTESGPFATASVADTVTHAAPVELKPASLPASEPVALPLPKPAEPPKNAADEEPKGKKGDKGKKAKAVKGKKKKKK